MMPRWKRLLLRSYRYGSSPYRRWAAARAARLGRAPVMVLFYHRVADEHPSSWTITNAQFTRHVRWLQDHFELISLSEAQRRIRSAANRRPAVSITFDDGYADNCQFALPQLIVEGIPVAYFVTVRNVLEGTPFPHDAAAGRPHRPNSIEQLRTLAAAGVEIGCHGRTHADLGKIRDPDRLHDEIAASGRDLQAAVGRPVRYFAFPFGLQGNFSDEAIRIAREAGYEGVCSAYGGYNFPGGDAFHLQRIHGDPEFERLKNWLTVDPRKAGRGRRDRAPAAAGRPGAVRRFLEKVSGAPAARSAP